MAWFGQASRQTQHAWRIPVFNRIYLVSRDEESESVTSFLSPFLLEEKISKSRFNEVYLTSILPGSEPGHKQPLLATYLSMSRIN
jgi:hypothetical protein